MPPSPAPRHPFCPLHKCDRTVRYWIRPTTRIVSGAGSNPPAAAGGVHPPASASEHPPRCPRWLQRARSGHEIVPRRSSTFHPERSFGASTVSAPELVESETETLPLTRFRGHLFPLSRRCSHAETSAALSGGVSEATGRAGPIGPDARGAVARVRTVGAGNLKLGAPSRP